MLLGTLYWNVYAFFYNGEKLTVSLLAFVNTSVYLEACNSCELQLEVRSHIMDVDTIPNRLQI